MTRISQLGRWRYRRALLPLVDAVAWGLALPVAVTLRYDLADSSPSWDGVVALSVLVVVTQLAIGAGFRLYQGRFRLGSLDEILTLFRIALAVMRLFLCGVDCLGPFSICPRWPLRNLLRFG